MTVARTSFVKPLMIVFAGLASLSLLIAATALLICVLHATSRTPAASASDEIEPRSPSKAPTTVPAKFEASTTGPALSIHLPASANARRFTLRLGQGFRFKDGVVVAKQIDGPDVIFRYIPPQVGGMTLRYNPISQQVEPAPTPTLTLPIPVMVTTHVKAFEEKPDVAHLTSGDIAVYYNEAPIDLKTRYILMMNQAGGQYLLTLDELEAPLDQYDAWRISFSYEPVQLPIGLAGGKISSLLPGKLVYRDWFRSKMIVRVDLATGKEEPIADGSLPSLADDGSMGYGDSSNAYLVCDATGKTRHTIRFDEEVRGPLLSPDGSRILGTVYRPGPEQHVGNSTFSGLSTLSVALFDLEGREITTFVGYDDATWTPDGKVIATGDLYEPGLFEIDPATQHVRPIDATINAPISPSVSPDGKTIAFVTGNRVWLIDRDGKNLRQPFKDGHDQLRPSFSPDGTKLVMAVVNQLGIDTSGDLYVFDLKTGVVTSLRTNRGLSLVPDSTSRLNWIP